MSVDLTKLNEAQREAVLLTEGPVLLIAGAGSGKTRVLTHRIAYIVEKRLAFPSQILAITFTNKAAAEMKERLYDMLTDDVGEMWISTIHSMCVRMLRRFAEKVGFLKSFSIYSEVDKDRVLKRVLDDMGLDAEHLKDYKWHIANAKNNNLSPDQYREELGKDVTEACRVYARYDAELKKSNAMDFDDLLIYAYRLLCRDEEAREYYQNKFRYIHVDEFQDTNVIQYELIRILGAKWNNVFAVGDDDQSIYAFRGAVVENVFRFQREFSGCRVLKLEQNYRSTQKILDVANLVISKNAGRMSKKLWTRNEGGTPVVIRALQDEAGEAAYAVHEINRLVREEGFRYSDCAVLMRVNALSRSFEQECMKYGISTRVYGGFKFFERKEIKDAVSYLRLLCNPFDEESLLRVINTPKRGLGAGAVDKLRAFAAERGESLFDALLSAEQSALPRSVLTKLLAFKDLVMELLTQVQLQKVEDFVPYLLERTGIRGMYADGSEDSINKNLNLDEFIASVKSFADANPGAGLEEYVESVTLISDLEQEDEGPVDAVSIATVHGVKGLEFRAVFVAGLEDGIFPISRAKLIQSEMEEERRLMYVAVTRAKERLYLTRARSRFMYGERSYAAESPFFKEVRTALGAEDEPSFGGSPAGYRSSYGSAYSSPYAAPSGGTSAPKPAQTVENVRKTPEKKDFEKFQPGVRVRHPKFGEGTIIRTEKGNGNVCADIAFPGIGVKTLSLNFAPLTLI